MAHPLFLSYSWDDLSEVDKLDTFLRLRGVPVWRDRREMQFGGYNGLSSPFGGDSSVRKRDLDAGAAEIDHRDQCVGGVESVSAV